jgi:hypothetical protein
VRQGDVEVVLDQRRELGDVVERQHLVVPGVARGEGRHGLQQVERVLRDAHPGLGRVREQ